MKVRTDFWQVVVATYTGSDKFVFPIIETYETEEEAVENYEQWVNDDYFAREPESYDGTFPGRNFEVETKNGNRTSYLKRVTDVPEEYFFRYVELNHKYVEKDVPLVFDMKDITKIRLFTKDDDSEVFTGTKKKEEPQVIDAIDDDVYRMNIWDSEIQPCATKTRAANGLKAHDIRTIGDLLKHSPAEVRRFKHVGVVCVEFLQKELREKYNINWW